MPRPPTPSDATPSDAGDRHRAGSPSQPKPPPATVLLLARHAVTAADRVRCSRVAHPGSTSPTRAASRPTALGERLAALPIAAVYASPIERTMQTAEAVAVQHGLEVRELPGVLEADYGEWTGGKLADLAKTDLWRTVQRAPSRARFPDGESLAEMQARMVATLEARRRRPPGRDRRRRVARRPDQGGDRALHRDASRPLPAHRRVAGVGHGVRALGRTARRC